MSTPALHLQDVNSQHLEGSAEAAAPELTKEKLNYSSALPRRETKRFPIQEVLETCGAVKAAFLFPKQPQPFLHSPDPWECHQQETAELEISEKSNLFIYPYLFIPMDWVIPETKEKG